MKTCLSWAVPVLCLAAAAYCEAANVAPVALDCGALGYSAVTNIDRRVEIATPGFSILPPQGEHWCYRLTASQGISFFKIPKFEKSFEQPPSREEVAALRMFSAIAISLKGFRDLKTNVQSPEELKSSVNLMIDEHLFSQIVDGVKSAEHRFRLLDSRVVMDNSSGASCARFDAKIEERGSVQAPGLVFLLNFTDNVVCRHPTTSDIDVIWVGFIERYTEGDKPISDTLKEEYEPFVQSLQFMPPR
jgi:hypothetical protein